MVLQLENQLKTDFLKIASNEAVDDLNEGGVLGKGCTVEWTLDSLSQATKFHEDCIKCVEDSARDILEHRFTELTERLTSGAGHDSVKMHARLHNFPEAGLNMI